MSSKEIKEYQDAVWDYLLEHCDVTPNGSLFVKFHTDSRENFERRIRARLIYKYHRGDPRQTEAFHRTLKDDFQVAKLEKKEKYLKEKKFRNTKKGRFLLWVKRVWNKTSWKSPQRSGKST